MDPAAEKEPPRRRGTVKWVPWLVPAIVLANTVMFIYTMYVNNCPEYSGSCVAGFLGRFSFQPMKENPLFGPSSDTLQKVGGMEMEKVVNDHQGWRLITSIWLHAGVLHILSNMLGLVIIGKPRFKVYQYVLWVLSLILLIVGLVVGTRMVLHGYDANKHCSWCRYLSCFPTNKWSCISESCKSSQTEDQLTLTCSRNMTRTYTLTLPNPNTSTFQLQRLCNQLCRHK